MFTAIKNKFGQKKPSDPMTDEKMHTGFETYRKKSKHFMDTEQQDNENPPLNENSADPNLKKIIVKPPQGKRKTSKLFKTRKLSKVSNNSILIKQDPKKSGGAKSNDKKSPPDKISNHTNSDRIKFHPEDEIKEYIVQMASYKPSLQRDPNGLDILAHADHLWLEHANHDNSNMPVIAYTYNTFDDSEQRILSVRPTFEYFEKEIPTNFLVSTAIGVDLCRLHFRTNISCSRKELVIEVVLKGRQIGLVTKYRDGFLVFDDKGKQIMTMPIQFVSEEKTKRKNKKIKKGPTRSCCSKKIAYELPMEIDNFMCQVYVTSRKVGPFGTIRGNGVERTEDCAGEPNGFYFMINEKLLQFPLDDPDPPSTLVKLYVFITLVALTVYYKDPSLPKSAKNSNATEGELVSDDVSLHPETVQNNDLIVSSRFPLHPINSKEKNNMSNSNQTILSKI